MTLKINTCNTEIREHAPSFSKPLQAVKIKKMLGVQFSTIVVPKEDSAHIFVLQKSCGKGNFGSVKLAENLKTGQLYAVKIIHENISASDAFKENRLEAPEQELQALKVMEMLEGSAYRFDSNKGRHVFYLFMKYFPGSQVGKIPRENLDYKKLVEIAIDTLQFLKEFHGKGFLHRDIKKENMIHNDEKNQTHLVDFGSALPVDINGEVVLENDFGMTGARSCWRQPDQKFHLSQYTDMYSLGNVFYDLFYSIQNYKQHLKENIATYDKFLRETDNPDAIVAIGNKKNELNTSLNKISSPEISHNIGQALQKMASCKASFSQITAAEALLEFQAIFKKFWEHQ